MKKIRNLLIMAAALIYSCSQSGPKEEIKTVSEEKKENVRIMELQMQTVARSVEYPANLAAWEEVHLVPASPGRIENITVEVSDRVSAGQLLVQMDQTQLRQAEIQLKNLEADFSRLDTLARYGSIARQQYDQLKTQLDVAKTNVEFLQRNARLASPFNGVVSGRYFEPGEMYSGAPNTPAGKAAVLSIVQIDRLKALVNISESYFPKVKTGMVAQVKTDVYPDQLFTARISRVYPLINAADRTFTVELEVGNRNGILRPGMFSRITIDLDKEEAILLPSNAVLKMQGSNDRYLFVEENGKARRIAVTTGKRYDDQIEVFSKELNPGARIIITGQARLLDGVPVTVMN